MGKEVHIISYFSLPTDVAAEFSAWPEFVSGNGYAVDLADSASSETVSVRLIKEAQEQYVAVKGTGSGPLFERVLGRVLYALGAHSDNLMVTRVTRAS